MPRKELTVTAIPGYFASMAAEHAWLRAHPAPAGRRGGDYERRDTITSLTMGVGSLLVPLVTERLLRPFVPGRGRYGKALVVTAVTAAALTTVADRVRRRRRPRCGRDDEPAERGDRVADLAERAARIGAVATVVAGGTALATAWHAWTSPEVLWRRRRVHDLGTGPLALALAVLGWDFLYYWNHRWMHTSRQAWAYHVVHHSSEHYNLSTALRQPVAGSFTVFLPYGLLSYLGIRPELVEQARSINLLYQYWIHTETIRRLGRAETVLNTPSHHRVHHGSNRRYLDRNHGSILITWDRWFGTFAVEDDDEPVVYGLTQNLETFDPLTVATHEYVSMLRDVARAEGWRDRLSFVLRSPGWAYRRRAELAEPGSAATTA